MPKAQLLQAECCYTDKATIIMKPTAIFYGSSTGQTRDAAFKIAEKLGISPADVYNVADTAPSVVTGYDNLILGSSTWGDGDLEENWFDFIDGLQSMYLKGKNIALFGCGDTTMTDTFCNAVGILHDRLVDTQATFVGEGFPYDGFQFGKSKAVKSDGKAYGLLLDNVNHEILTDGRIEDWTKMLGKELA